MKPRSAALHTSDTFPCFVHPQVLKHVKSTFNLGRQRCVAIRLPHPCLLRHDVEGHSEGFGALHNDVRLWDAYQLVAKYRHHWHDDGRLAGGPQRLLFLLPSLVAGP